MILELSFIKKEKFMNRNSGKFVFSHILNFIPRYEFDQCVLRYGGNYRARSFSCYDQFLSMAFAQLTSRESLRDIEICLKAMSRKLYHIGFRGTVSKSTLSEANEKRSSEIYSDFAKVLMLKASKLYSSDSLAEKDLAKKLDFEINNSLYALDSSVIDLCLSTFPWAKYKTTKSAIKLHTLLDLRGNIPSFVVITDGKGSDPAMMDKIFFEAGSIYLMDRGYTDFKRLHRISQLGAFFVIRMHKRIIFKRVYSHPIDKNTGLICDQTVLLNSEFGLRTYPSQVRRVRFYDKDTQNDLEFLTNNFELPALTIAKLYKQRWQVELFFKWIKQHLCIKAFFGTSKNAVETQIWIAISIYLLIAIIKKTLKLDESLYTLSQIFSLSLFERTNNLSDFIKLNCTKSEPEITDLFSL
jgi:hypothetical protein